MSDGLSVRNISKAFGPTQILTNVSFHVPPAAKLLITGPSGAGKTTLLRIIAGLESPDEGEVFIAGRRVTAKNETLAPHRRGIGFVFQSPALWPHMTVRENIAFGLASLPEAAAKQRIAELLEKAGLQRLETRYPHQISGGEAKRVSLLRSLAPQPQCLLLDEPFSNLDRQTKTALLSYVLETTAALKISLIFVTHDEYEVETVAGPVYSLACVARKL